MKRNPGESIAQINVEFKGIFCFVFYCYCWPANWESDFTVYQLRWELKWCEAGATNLCQVAFQTHCTNWQHGKLEKGWNGKLCCSYRTNYKFVRAEATVGVCVYVCMWLHHYHFTRYITAE